MLMNERDVTNKVPIAFAHGVIRLPNFVSILVSVGQAQLN